MRKEGEGKGRKHLKNKSTFFFYKTEGKGRKYLKRGNIFCEGEEKQRREIFGEV